jgi:thiamine-monophosphate kinase
MSPAGRRHDHGGWPRTLGLTAIGRATHRPVPSRAGAQVGDGIWITGAVGAAMLGLEALQAGDSDPAASLAYRRPDALLAQGQALAPLVTAMMDLSDGLLLDAYRMGIASGVTLAIDSAAVPIATPEGRRDEALRWGDDYQLLFILPESVQPPVTAHRIGKVLARKDAPLMLDGRLLADASHLGWQHEG